MLLCADPDAVRVIARAAAASALHGAGSARLGAQLGVPAATVRGWLRGVLDGQVKLFAAMLHQEKAVIAQARVPDDTTEITQVRELLDSVDLRNAVVTADAAHACRETAEYIAGERESDYFLSVIIFSADLTVFAVAAAGVLCAFAWVVNALPEQCLRRRARANLLFVAAFRTRWLLRERCAVTCHRRRRPGQARRRQGRLEIMTKGNQPSLQRAAFDAVQQQGPREPDHTELDRSHGRAVRRAIWVADAGNLDFPHASQIARIRRDRYDTDGQLTSKEIAHAVTSLDADRADAARLAEPACGQWGIDPVGSKAATVRADIHHEPFGMRLSLFSLGVPGGCAGPSAGSQPTWSVRRA